MSNKSWFPLGMPSLSNNKAFKRKWLNGLEIRPGSPLESPEETRVRLLFPLKGKPRKKDKVLPKKWRNLLWKGNPL